MKIQSLILLFILMGISIACDQMEDNYAQYLEEEKIYSPKVSNLTADVGLREATLHWENPEGDIAKNILITYDTTEMRLEEMVDSIYLGGLELKGYDVSVYTLDAFENLSVPETVIIFPNGEE